MKKSGGRKYSGEKKAVPLLNWLNQHRDNSGEHITSALECMASNGKDARQQVERLLRSYTFSPALQQAHGNWAVSWQAQSSSPDENAALEALLTLLAKGGLQRLKKCACGKWFFARLKEQSYCSAKCQHNSYRYSDEYRKMRKEYMRQYRQTHRP